MSPDLNFRLTIPGLRDRVLFNFWSPPQPECLPSGFPQGQASYRARDAITASAGERDAVNVRHDSPTRSCHRDCRMTPHCPASVRPCATRETRDRRVPLAIVETPPSLRCSRSGTPRWSRIGDRRSPSGRRVVSTPGVVTVCLAQQPNPLAEFRGIRDGERQPHPR